jgi:hypothetical protein
MLCKHHNLSNLRTLSAFGWKNVPTDRKLIARTQGLVTDATPHSPRRAGIE